MKQPKQVIIVRKDLKMRRGKEIAQGAHASMKVILDMMTIKIHDGHLRMGLETDAKDIINWINGSFTKIALYVNSEEELLNIHEHAKSKGIPTTLITDSGLTEFHGVATNTCIAVGPHNRDEIDAISGHLKLA